MMGPANLKRPFQVVQIRELAYFLSVVAASLIIGLLIPDDRNSLVAALVVSALGTAALVAAGFRLQAWRADRIVARSRELADHAPWPRIKRPYQVPRELPPAPSDFVGRDDELEQLRQGIAGTRDDGPYVAVICGEPGIGKSALAVMAAHRGARLFGGGQLFIQMRGASGQPTSVTRVREHFVASLKQPNDRLPATDELPGRYLALAQQFAVIFVLDDMAPEFDISSLLPLSPRSAVLVTCRTDPAWPGVDYELIRLEPLRPNDAVAMLRQTVAAETGAADPDELAAAAEPDLPDDQTYLAALAGLCGRKPLALRAAGTALADRPNWDISLLAKQARSRSRSGRFSSAPPGGIFDAAYALLTTDEQKVLRLLGVLQAGSFAPWMIAAALGIGEDKAERLATRLAEAGLIERYSPGSGTPSYRAEDPVLDYARMRAVGEDDPVLHWRDLVAEGESKRRMTLLEQSFGSLDELLQQHAGFPQAIDAVRTALSLAREQDSRWVEANACAALADLYTDLGEVVTARDLARQATALAKEVGDRQSEARAHRCLTRLERRRGRFDAAIAHANAAMTCALSIDDRPEQVRTLVEKAIVVSRQRRADEAGRIAAQALTICSSLDTAATSLEVAVKWCQGRIWLHAGRYDAAAGILREDKAIADGLGNQRMGAWIDHTSAGVALAVRNWPLAERHAVAGLDTFTKLQHRYGVAHCRHRLGQIRLQRERFDDAIRLLRDSLESFHNCEDIWIEREVSLDLADAYLSRGHLQDAIQMQRVARRDDRQMGSSSLNQRTVVLLARTLLARVLPWYRRKPRGAGPGRA